MIPKSSVSKISAAKSGINVEQLKDFFRRRENPGRRSADKNAQLLRAERDALLKEIPIAIFYLDRNLRYSSVSQAFAQSVGYSISDVIGKTVFDLFPKKLAEVLQTKYHYVLRTGESICKLDYGIVNQKGQQARFSTALAPFYNNNGQIAGLVGVSNDISQLAEAYQDIARTSRDNHELLRENRLLTRRLFEIQESDRRHIAQELHDELGQWLAAVRAELRVVMDHIGRDSEIYNRVQSVNDITESMQTVVHDMLTELRPGTLDKLGLADSLRELRSEWLKHHPDTRFELIITEDMDGPDAIDKTISITVYRLVQEALNNACKYAQAKKIIVRLSREKISSSVTGTLLLSIEDDGVGFRLDRKSTGFGLLGMRERVIAANGEFLLQSSPGMGVQITARLPLEPKS